MFKSGVKNTAVPCTLNVLLLLLKLVANVTKSRAFKAIRLLNNSRPCFHVVNNKKRTRPKASGNHPPAAIFTMLAAKKMKSMTINGKTPNRVTRWAPLPQRSCRTKCQQIGDQHRAGHGNSISCSRLADEPKPITNAITAIISVQLIRQIDLPTGASESSISFKPPNSSIASSSSPSPPPTIDDSLEEYSARVASVVGMRRE